MIYTTGTIAVSGNTLTGTGTNFTAAGSLIRVGCTVLAMTSPPQAFQITGITSGTVMTVSPAASPTLAAGTKYSILLSDSLSVDGLAQDIAETFKMYQSNISGFADVMNSAGDVTITINGVSVTVPGQKSLAKKGANKDITSLTGLTTPLSVGQGGTGMNRAHTAAELRTNAGLEKVINVRQLQNDMFPITQDSSNAYLYYKVALLTYPGTGQSRLSLMVCNGLDYGLLGNAIDYINVTARTADANSLSSGSPATFLQVRRLGTVNSAGHFKYGLVNNGTGLELWLRTSKYFTGVNFTKMAIAGPVTYAVEGTGAQTAFTVEPSGMAWATEIAVYDALNTTKASDGTLKSASPVARIGSSDTSTRPDIDEGVFEWCGYGVANDEARGIKIIRDDIGVYRVTGAKSLASSGWRLLPPRDPNGSGDLGVVTAEQLDDEIIVSLFRLKMVLSGGEIVIQPGEPIDVPANSWIDIRMDMPEPIIPPEPSQTQPE